MIPGQVHKAGESRTLIVIGGPTASGKTDAAVELARHFRTEVISADSRQFYHAMRIGTARPSAEEMKGVRHHFIGHLGLEQTWSAGAFARAAEPVLQDLIRRTGYAIIVGGSGLYIDAVVKGLDHLPVMDVRLREKLMVRAREHGPHVLAEDLRELDPVTYDRIDRRNPHRVIRALEICMISGKPASMQQTERSDRVDMRVVKIALELPRQVLYGRIDRRVDQMIGAGLVAEARNLLPYRHLNALRTVGYRELFDHFDGAYGLLRAVELIKQHTRNYAKRQITWFKNSKGWVHVRPDDTATMIRLAES